MAEADGRGIGRREAALLGLIVACAAAAYALVFTGEFRHTRARHALVRQCVPVNAPTALQQALRKVPRHRFVRDVDIERAYVDMPLRTSHGRAITQPSLVAFMMAQLDLSAGDRVLAVDASSGYEVAVLAEQCAFVAALALSEAEEASSAARLEALGYENVEVAYGPGEAGFAEHAPYDAIFARCSVPDVPEAWVAQLKPGGRIIVSVGSRDTPQRITLFVKEADGSCTGYPLRSAVFMPMDLEADLELRYD